jgi:hypothetical protein
VPRHETVDKTAANAAINEGGSRYRPIKCIVA